MRLQVIGDEDTVVGFRMAGVEGTIVESEEEAREALDEAEGEDEVLIISDQVAEWLREEIDQIRYGAELPLIVEAPGPEGPTDATPSLFRLIREAVGIKFEA